jgi:hypothetical protein
LSNSLGLLILQGEFDSLWWRCYKNNSNNAKYVTLQKYFSHPSLIVYLLLIPPIKLKLGLQINGKLLTTTRLNQLTYVGSQSIPCVRLCYALCKNTTRQLFCETKLTCFDFSSSNFLLEGHLLSIGGVALNCNSFNVLKLKNNKSYLMGTHQISKIWYINIDGTLHNKVLDGGCYNNQGHVLLHLVQAPYCRNAYGIPKESYF